MRKLKWIYFIFALTIVIFGALPTQAQNDVARVRIGHFALDAGPIDVYIDGILEFESFVYPDLTTWVEIEPGISQVALVEPGELLANPLLPPVDLDLQPGDWKTVTLIGERTAETLEAHVLIEDFSEMLPSVTRITVFHAIPRSGPISLYANDQLLAGGLAFPNTLGDNDGARTVDITADEYNLRLTPALNEDDVFFSTQSVLGGNRHYFIAAIGRPGNPNGRFVTTNLADFGAVATEESMAGNDIDVGEGNAYLRVGHFASDYEALDLYLDGRISDVQNVSYVGLSDWVSLPVGVYEAAFAPAETSINQAVIPSLDVILVEDTWNTIAIVEEVDSNSLIARLIVEDYSDLDEDETRITFFHAVTDAPPLEMQINDDLYGPIEFPGSSPSSANGTFVVNLKAGAYSIEFVEAGTSDGDPIFALPPDTPLAPGNHYFIGLRNTMENLDIYVQPITQDAVIASFE